MRMSAPPRYGDRPLASVATVLTPALAQSAAPADFDRGMNTMWEVLWHQSGVPTRLVRWDQDLKVRVSRQAAAGRAAGPIVSQ